MSWIESSRVLGMFCDKPSCGKRIEGGYAYPDAYREIAEEAGWTLWVGRSQRWYCPDHGPFNPATMRKLTVADTPAPTKVWTLAELSLSEEESAAILATPQRSSKDRAPAPTEEQA